MLEIAVSEVGLRKALSPLEWHNLYEYALINRGSGEAVLMRGGFGGVTGGLIIPDGQSRRGRLNLEPGRAFQRSTARIDRHWLNDAELLRFEWRSLGAFPLAVEASPAQN